MPIAIDPTKFKELLLFYRFYAQILEYDSFN
jgi:hypothetical protein